MGYRVINIQINDILEKFANSGWDLIAIPAQDWLDASQDGNITPNITNNLINAVRAADKVCGNCGCEFDDLYKILLAEINT